MMKRHGLIARLLTLALLAALPAQVWAWGEKGHKAVALIAYRLLNEQARKNVDVLLEGRTIEAASVWPDEIRRANCPAPGQAQCNPQYRPETANWHFVDVPYEAAGYDAARDCKPSRYGDCVVLALEQFRAVLDDSTRRPFDAYNVEQQRKFRDALAFVVHFVGDLHQPLHAAERKHDAGGNLVLVTWEGEPKYPWGDFWNLHALWDDYLVERNVLRLKQGEQDHTHYADLLFRGLGKRQIDFAQLKAQSLRDGQGETFVDWANQSHAAAKQFVYDALPDKTVKKIAPPRQPGAKPREVTLVVLDDKYFDAARAAKVDEQLQLAGVRLARLLNEIFDKQIPPAK